MEDIKGGEEGHWMVDPEEEKTRFPAILEQFIGGIQEPHTEVEHEHCPAPTIDAEHRPCDIKHWHVG